MAKQLFSCINANLLVQGDGNGEAYDDDNIQVVEVQVKIERKVP